MKGCSNASRRSSRPSAGTWCGQVRRLQRAAFEEPGGESLREWIDNCPNQLYSALTFMGGAVWRKHLMDDLGDQGDVTALIDRAATAELAALMENLGGNCVETMAETFASHRPRPADLLSSPTRSRAGARRSRATRTITAG
jgi:pyruvate dehydrogenase complex dehydrogenase (E1) component